MHHQVVVCCEFDVLFEDLEHMMCTVPCCEAACGLRLKSHTVAFISTSQTVKNYLHLLCVISFFSYKLPAKFNTKYYNCTVKDKLPQCTSVRRGGVKVWLHPFLILIPDEGDGQLQSFDCSIPWKETAARVK